MFHGDRPLPEPRTLWTAGTETGRYIRTAGTETGRYLMDTGGIYIGLGSNLGDRARHIRDALAELARPGDIRLIRCSNLHETEPVGGPPGQGRFLNAVAELDTDLSPRRLLARLLEIEARHGRVRTVRNGARTLDLDLLLYRDQRIVEPDLIVPHPRMWDRTFVMGPLAEICPASRLTAWRLSLVSAVRCASGPAGPTAGDRACTST